MKPRYCRSSSSVSQNYPHCPEATRNSVKKIIIPVIVGGVHISNPCPHPYPGHGCRDYSTRRRNSIVELSCASLWKTKALTRQNSRTSRVLFIATRRRSRCMTPPRERIKDLDICRLAKNLITIRAAGFFIAAVKTTITPTETALLPGREGAVLFP